MARPPGRRPPEPGRVKLARPWCLTVLSLCCLLFINGPPGCGDGERGAGETVLSTPWPGRVAQRPVNRARMAKVEASSSRIGQLPYHGTSLFDLIPTTWPRLVPRFVQDGSMLTRWASSRNECPYLVYDFGRGGPKDEGDQVPIHRIALSWEEDVPREFAIEISSDAVDWNEVFRGKPRPRDLQEIVVTPPRRARWVRLSSLECPVREGISLYEMAVYGPVENALPAAVSAIQVSLPRPDAVALAWEDPPGNTFCYEVYRLPGPDPPDPESFLVGVTRRPEFLDEGLAPGRDYYYRIVPETFSGTLGPSTLVQKVSTPFSSPQPPAFGIRGVVEGFYNQPWSHLDRLDMIRFLGSRHLNYYLYAPKIEGFHRSHWRDPYPQEELELFRELVASAKAHDVTFCYGLSPGMDFRWDDPSEVGRILEKFESLYRVGVRAFALLFDDTPDTAASDRVLAQKHVGLVREVYSALCAWGPQKCDLVFVPTIYFKTVSDLQRIDPAYVEYLDGLAELPAEIPVAWVGPGMPYSAFIGVEEALEFSRHVGRRVLIWDNYPANDNFFLYEPFLGPYRNRAPDLGEGVCGVLSNPMNYAQSSMIPLWTFAEYLADPYSYDPGEAFEEAISRIGGARGARPLRTYALQFYGHPIIPPTGVESPELAALIDSFWGAYAGDAYPEGLEEALREHFASFARLVDDLQGGVDNHALFEEVLEPARKIAIYGRAGLVALDILRSVHEGHGGEIPDMVQDLTALMEQASMSPWRPGENYVNGLMALLFGCRPVRVDVVGGFLGRTIEVAARSSAGSRGGFSATTSPPRPHPGR
jgi:hyaluronoglucosaminidase